MLDKSEAKSIILELDLKPIESYVPCVQRDFQKVMKSDKKPKRGKHIEIKPVDEVIDVEQPIEVVEHVVIEPVYEVILKDNE
jgi:hypothetical protein